MGYIIIFAAIIVFGVLMFYNGKESATPAAESEATRIRRCMEDVISMGAAHPVMYCSPEYFYGEVIKLAEYQKIVAPSDDKLGYIFGMPIYAACLEKGRLFLITNHKIDDDITTCSRRGGNT